MSKAVNAYKMPNTSHAYNSSGKFFSEILTSFSEISDQNTLWINFFKFSIKGNLVYTITLNLAGRNRSNARFFFELRYLDNQLTDSNETLQTYRGMPGLQNEC